MTTTNVAGNNIRIQKLQVLVGRDDEVQLLRDAYQRVSDSQTCEAVLVFGESGSGKTALVRQTFHTNNDKPLDDGTLFVSGKFDEINAARPFSAIVDSLTHLCRKTFLQDNDDFTVSALKEKILERLGAADLEILCNLVPALATVFAVGQDHETSVDASDIVENVTFAFPRFAEIVRSFLYTVAGSLEKPLILFLDDVQWADPESLSLITSLSSLHSSCRNLLLILAYRDNDEYQVNQSKLMSTTTGFHVKEIKLSGLDLQGTNNLVAETLQMNPEDTLQLSDLIRQRTGGNIYFMVEFLQMLHREELLRFSLGSFRWEWNIKKIQGETDVTDNVARLLTAKIQQLSPQVQSMLQLAACVGFYFEIQILERIFNVFNEGGEKERGLQDDSTHEKLERDEILLHAAHLSSSSFREMIDLASQENLIDPVRDSKYKFSHDRVQQAAYQMIPAGDEKDLMHWRIGQILWDVHKRQTNGSSDDWVLFTSADQLNRGSLHTPQVVGDDETRLALVRLNLEAGKKAFEKSAFKYAAEFLDRGVLLLDTDTHTNTQSRWLSEYQLCLDVYTLSAECEYIVGSFEKCAEKVNKIFPNAKLLDDKLRPFVVLVESLGARGKIKEALDQAVTVLRLLGERLPRRPNSLHVLIELVRVKRAMKIHKIDEVLLMPDMTSPAKIAAMKLLQTVATFAWFGGDKAFLAISSMRMFWLTLKYGICKNSPYALAAFGIVVGILGDIDTAYEIGKVSLELLKRPHTLPCFARSTSVIFTFLQHLKQPLVGCLDNLMEGYHTGMRSGEIEGAAMCLCPYAYAGLFLGKKLDVVASEIAGFRQTYREAFSQHFTIQSLIPVHQFAFNMMGLSENILALNGDAMHEVAFLKSVQETGNDVAEEVVYIMRMLLLYIMNEVEEASKEVPKLDVNAARGTHIALPFTVMYVGLVMLGMARKTGRRKYIWKAESFIRKLKKLARFGDLNVPPNLQLLQAERATLRRNHPVALVKKAFDNTMNVAARSGFSVIEAIANERAGEYMISVGDLFWAETYLSRALLLYGEWGATPKMRQMVDNYNFLAEPRENLQRRFDMSLGDRFSFRRAEDLSRRVSF